MQNRLAWTFAITTIALFMTALDNLGANNPSPPTVTAPFALYFTAFPTRFNRIWRNRCRAW